MRIYARPGWRLARQLAADSFVLVWIAVWAFVAAGVHRALGAMAVPAERSAVTARQVGESMREAQDQVGRVPMVGDEVSVPFGKLSSGLGELAAQADAQVVLVHRLAMIGSVLTFAVPVAVVLVLWLPPRVRFIRRAAAARRFIDADADLSLFALRAMANQPMDKLARISDDPVAAWRGGNDAVVRQLAAL